ncbi:MAG: leucyl aminopeptidase [Oceanospirillales bacterium]|uniref:Probable cytosol aminopeptidase n=1 Tax=Marinobacterium halophilum TaxID=267374 RepID=A0A2P8ESU6_9GAMM|nr:leucyl aminopeptidase [Marinobacterium halophilum]MBR9829754.1 leucyl aminopeptidase [Oceanospirillales bacterium]PSL12556.1 aminopeptidase A [Marinobacterium halophilum]
MDFEIINGSVEALETECIVVALDAEGTLCPSAAAIDQASGGYLTDLVGSGDISGKAGEQLLLFKVPGIKARRVLLVGLGTAKERKDHHYRKLVKGITATLKKSGISGVIFAFDGCASYRDDVYRATRQLVEWVSADFYQYDETKSKKASPVKLENIQILLSEDDTELGEGALLDGVAIANGVSSARELGNLPGNICTPVYLAERAEALGEEFTDLDIKILDEDAMAELGMNCLLSVGKGSAQPSRLIVIEYNGGESDEKPHVLVGKGITFDTGGISLKPGAGMDEMKYDMCGAASVFGAMEAVAEMQLPLNVVGIIAAAENMPGSQATKPGDVVTTMSGQTVEILNTDAEGRLVLCDALTYAGRYEPESVIDIATLTGACIIALGHHATGILANDEDLAGALLDAGVYSADRGWPLPLWDEFQEQLDSNFADIANIGGRPAGTITAACFLSRFTKEYRWAHLDIAGVAWNSNGKEKGATGRCVPLLSQYLLDLSEQVEGDEHSHTHEG